MATKVETYEYRNRKWQIRADKNSQLDYSFDWTAWLTREDDQLSSVEFVLDPKLTAVNQGFDAASATVWLTIKPEARVGDLLQVTCRVTTNNSPPRIEDQTVYIKVVER